MAHLVTVSVANASRLRRRAGHGAAFTTPERLGYQDPATKEIRELVFRSPSGAPTRLEITTAKPLQLDLDKPADADNWLGFRLCKERMSDAAILVLSDPQSENRVKASKSTKVIRLQGRIAELFERGDEAMLQALLRRKVGSLKGYTADRVYNELLDAAQSQTEELSAWMDSEFEPLRFLLDEARQENLVKKDGAYFKLADTGQGKAGVILGESEDVAVHYLLANPDLARTLDRKLSALAAGRARIDAVSNLPASEPAAAIAQLDEAGQEREADVDPNNETASLAQFFAAAVEAKLIKQVIPSNPPRYSVYGTDHKGSQESVMGFLEKNPSVVELIKTLLDQE